MRPKMYLVKREVIATSIKNALSQRGNIYEIVLADEKNWPEQKKKKVTGFKNK